MARKTTTKLSFQVTLQQPTGMSIKDMREYIKAAIQSHRGGFDPQDVMFEADLDDIKIHLVNKETTYG